jgi:hypothetical protein
VHRKIAAANDALHLRKSKAKLRKSVRVSLRLAPRRAKAVGSGLVFLYNVRSRPRSLARSHAVRERSRRFSPV